MDWRFGFHWRIVVDDESSLFLHFHITVIRHQALDILFGGKRHCLSKSMHRDFYGCQEVLELVSTVDGPCPVSIHAE